MHKKGEEESEEIEGKVKGGKEEPLKSSEVEKKEGRGGERKGKRRWVSWWEFMMEEEGEGWKEVRKKKDKDRGTRKERRKRWFEEREERIRRERRLGEGE